MSSTNDSTNATNGPVRLIGRWGNLSANEREAVVTRGLDKIFDPRLRRDIGELIEDVRLHGDDGVARALKSSTVATSTRPSCT